MIPASEAGFQLMSFVLLAGLYFVIRLRYDLSILKAVVVAIVATSVVMFLGRTLAGAIL